MEQRRATANSQSTAGAVVKALLAAKAAGELPGIHGRLGTIQYSTLRNTTVLQLHPTSGDGHDRDVSIVALRLSSFSLCLGTK